MIRSCSACLIHSTFLCLAFVLAGILMGSLPAAADDSRPNIVLVLADDLGVNDLACYGRTDHRTPHLDRLAQQGIRFTCAYTAQPICSPSRAALLTGKSPARLHLTNYLPGRPDSPSQKLLQPRIEGQLPLEEVTLAELLRDAGYTTGLFGKWHLGNAGFGPREQGFDTVVTPPANTTPTDQEGGKGEYAITAAAEAFIEANRDRPFFCYLPHNNPHIPLQAKSDLIEKNDGAFHPVYAAMIETLDDAVARLLHKIDSLGLTDRTIFIFTSDNGGLHVLESPGTPATHNSPYRAGKGYVYEGGLRVPLIARWPSQTNPGNVCEIPIVLTDLMPTMLEAAGIDPSKTVGPLDGVSIAPVLRGETLPERTLYWHFPNYTNQGGRPAGAIRQGPWKLIEHFENGEVELYNLAHDVSETNNLAPMEKHRAEQLRQKLAMWRTRVGAQMPSNNPQFNAEQHNPLYVDQDPSHLTPEATAALTEPHWKKWRQAMNTVTQDRNSNVTPAHGDVRLHARDARVHAVVMRYEPEPYKNVLGYWTKVEDWAEWEFQTPASGIYEIEVQQGCGDGSGGAEVAIEIAGKTLTFVVQETGHFQHMIQRTIGTVHLPEGDCKIAVKPRTKPGVAVMDLRRIVLRPVTAND